MAAFDILSNASFRNESQETRFLLRSFLINKIPVLLTTLSISMFPPLTPEFCIGQALTHVDTQAFPTLSSMFDASNDGSGFISDVRQDFLFACCLHGLIPESSIEPLLGEIPMQELPPGGKYTRELLMGQCASDPGRVETLLGEIEGMDGNAGAVVGAIVEVRPSCPPPRCKGRVCAEAKVPAGHSEHVRRQRDHVAQDHMHVAGPETIFPGCHVVFRVPGLHSSPDL